ncbi:MAG TPA: hypothetical protein VGQ49_05485 [Bryobacteraceae bacterium]|nr:hypothetical protein [Bryobacteraceae bacterium]
MWRAAFQFDFAPLSRKQFAFSGASGGRNPHEGVEHWVGVAFLNELSELLRSQKAIAARRLRPLGHGDYRILVILAAADRKIKRAAENGPVLVDGRRRIILLCQLIQKGLNTVGGNVSRPALSETFSDLGQVIVKTAASMLAMFFPPVIQEFAKEKAIELARWKVPAFGNFGPAFG